MSATAGSSLRADMHLLEGGSDDAGRVVATVEAEPEIRIELLADHLDLASTLAAWHWREWGDDRSSETIDDWEARIRSRAGRDAVPFTLVAFLDSEPVGAVSVCWDDLDDEFATHGPWVSGMVVRGPARNLGIGRALMATAEQRTSRFGHDELWLHTGEAAACYLRCGWHVEREKRRLGRDAVMRKQLPGTDPRCEPGSDLADSE